LSLGACRVVVIGDTPRDVAAARAILDDPARHAEIIVALREVRRRLGRGGAAGRAAAIALEILRGVP